MTDTASKGPRLESANKLAAHLTMSRANVRYFEERGLFMSNGGAGYDLDQCRDKYIAHLRSEFRRNPRAELEADFQKHKSRWLQLRIAKAEGELMPVAEFDQAIQTLAGLTLTSSSSRLVGVTWSLTPHSGLSFLRDGSRLGTSPYRCTPGIHSGLAFASSDSALMPSAP